MRAGAQQVVRREPPVEVTLTDSAGSASAGPPGTGRPTAWSASAALPSVTASLATMR